MSLCVIPARGGSKRIPRKNIRPFAGRPMIAWSIAAAREAGCFGRIVVSTDDKEIAAVARAEGVEVPFLRQGALADDHTPTIPVIADAIDRLGLTPEVPVCCLYATAPFVSGTDLAAGAALLERTQARFVVSITSYAFPIQRALRRDPQGAITMMEPANIAVRSQDLEEAWHDAGQFYWGRAESWTSGTDGVFGQGAVGLPLPRHRVQDIDTPEDWTRAELMQAALK